MSGKELPNPPENSKQSVPSEERIALNIVAQLCIGGKHALELTEDDIQLLEQLASADNGVIK